MSKVTQDLRQKLEKEVYPKLAKDFKIKNKMRIPKPVVCYIQIGIGKMVTQSPDNKPKILEDTEFILSKITGQKPKLVVSKKAIAGFKLRGGEPIALLVTLRNKKLFEFVDRFLTYALPRMKDFSGLKKNNFDKNGNINFGIKEHIIFPETISDKIHANFGLQITLNANGRIKEENIKLWEYMGFPVRIQ